MVFKIILNGVLLLSFTIKEYSLHPLPGPYHTYTNTHQKVSYQSWFNGGHTMFLGKGRYYVLSFKKTTQCIALTVSCIIICFFEVHYFCFYVLTGPLSHFYMSNLQKQQHTNIFYYLLSIKQAYPQTSYPHLPSLLSHYQLLTTTCQVTASNPFLSILFLLLFSQATYQTIYSY